MNNTFQQPHCTKQHNGTRNDKTEHIISDTQSEVQPSEVKLQLHQDDAKTTTDENPINNALSSTPTTRKSENPKKNPTELGTYNTIEMRNRLKPEALKQQRHTNKDNTNTKPKVEIVCRYSGMCNGECEKCQHLKELRIIDIKTLPPQHEGTPKGCGCD